MQGIEREEGEIGLRAPERLREASSVLRTVQRASPTYFGSSGRRPSTTTQLQSGRAALRLPVQGSGREDPTIWSLMVPYVRDGMQVSDHQCNNQAPYLL